VEKQTHRQTAAENRTPVTAVGMPNYVNVGCIAQAAGFVAARRCLLRSRPLLFVSFMPARVARCGG